MKKSAAIGAAIGLLASSTAAVAAAPSAAQTGYQAPNAWTMLSVLSPSGATVLGGSNATAQPSDVPPPPGPPPPPVVAEGGAMSGGVGELLPIALWFGLIAIALATSDNGGSDRAIGNPNSPA
jgi:hypothetical protein